MQVRHYMTAAAAVTHPDEPVVAAARLMRQRSIGALPVCEDERLLGVVTDRDIAVRAVAEELTGAHIGDIMTKEPLYCFEDDPLDQALLTMKSEQVRRLPVLNRDKQLVGIVALADVATVCDSQRSAASAPDCSEKSPG